MGNAELNGVTRAIGEAFAREHASVADQVAALALTVQAAQDIAAAATQRAEALAAQVAGYEAALEVLRASTGAAIAAEGVRLERSTVAGLSVDGARLVVRRSDGSELAADIPRPDLEAVAVLVVEKHLDRLRGDKGDKGDEGSAGVVDLDELAGILRGEPEFLASVRGERGDPGPPGAPCEPWCTGVHRAGVRRSHFIGRTYEATADTTDEPGDSPHWRRIGTAGLRHIGGKDPVEAGDLHTKDRDVFLFDGARSWLLFAKPLTEGEALRMVKPLRQQVQGTAQALAALDNRCATVADLARGANANSTEALRWISQRAEAIDRVLEGLA